MGFTAKATSGDGKAFETPPPGAHPAVLIGLIDLGTQTVTFQGDAKSMHKIMFIWELTAEHKLDGDTFVVSADYTWSLNKKSRLRPIVEGYLGRSLRDDEEFDFGSMLLQPCQITLTEGTSSSGKTFVEVKGVCKPMRGLTVPAPTRHPFAFHLADQTSSAGSPEIPEWVPPLYGRKVADEIAQSPEWLALPGF